MILQNQSRKAWEMTKVVRAVMAWTLTAFLLSPFLARAAAFNMLSCCPGENNATQARFVWHSDSNACTLWYAKASAPGSAVQATCESFYKPVSFRSSDVNYYKYTAALSSLDPGTEYIYWVEAGGSQSGVQRFKTAGTSGSYNFLWMSDVHAHPDNPGKISNVNKLYADAVSKTSASGGIDFIFFTGDYAKYGSRYDNWQQWNGSPTMTDNMFALLVGNHEYYYTGGKVSDVPNRDESKMWHNKWILACRNDPKNGAMGANERLETSYWFIRDSVLFVCIDSLVDFSLYMSDDLYTNAVSYQKTWFRNVVQSQAGKFRYIIVAQHDPWMKKNSTSSISNSDYRKWYALFDEFKVDLALSSDDHVYHRSNPLSGDAKVSSTKDGTVYMVSPCIDEQNYSTTLITSFSGDAAKYLHTASESGAFGACWIEVRPSGLKVTYFWDDVNGSYSMKDAFTILPKDRGGEYEYDPSGGTTGGDATPHTRYRFAVDAPRSDTWCMQLSEIELLDTSGNVIPSSAFTLAYDSTTIPVNDSNPFPAAESPANAADGVHTGSGKWLDWRAGLSETAAVRSAVWLDFCFAEPTAVSGYQWYTAWDNGTYPGRTPISWTFSASDDGGATWTVLDKVEGFDTTTENNALAYSKRIETPQPPAPTGVHGKWLGGNGGNRFSVAANWDDGEVPVAGDALDFSSVTSATTIDADINATFGVVTMGTGVVTFTGNLTATSFSDTSKIAVGANATVKLVGDLVFANATDKRNDYIVNAIAAGGAFVVTGDIVSSAAGKGYVVPTINGGDGVIVAKGLAQNSSCSDNPSFRLVRDAAGTVRWVIGADGISGTKNYWLLNNGGKPTAIVKADDSDFTVSAKIGNRQVATLRFDTTGRDGLGHTISLTGGIYREGNVYVEGTGTVSCGYVQSDSSNPFTVTDTATLVLLSGSNIGTGGVTVNSGAAVAVSGAGTATLGGTLTLQGGSRLVVGAAVAGQPPYLTAKGVSFAGNVGVVISSQAVGTFTVLTRTDGSFTDSDLAKLSLSVTSPDASLASSLVITDGGKSIAVSTVADWPANWNGGHAANAAMQAAFATWAATPGNDATAARAEGAFLLGLDLADYTEDLKMVSVAFQGNKFTIDTNMDLTKVRGRLYVLVADSPADITKSGTKITGTVADLTKLVEINASAPAKFFKVGVDYAVGNQ